MKDAWPFLEPVDRKQVPDYYCVIKSPMDLSTLNKRLSKSLYQTKEAFADDFRLIISNCRQYNDPRSLYVRLAGSLEAKFNELYALVDDKSNEPEES